MNSERWQFCLRLVTAFVLVHIALTFVLCLRDVDLPSGASTELHFTLPDSGGGPWHPCNDDCGSCICCTALVVTAVSTFEWNPVSAEVSDTFTSSPIVKYLPPLKQPPRA